MASNFLFVYFLINSPKQYLYIKWQNYLADLKTQKSGPKSAIYTATRFSEPSRLYHVIAHPTHYPPRLVGIEQGP